MEKATREDRDAAVAEWREAGEHFRAATQRLVEAFQAGWSKELTPGEPAGLRAELQRFVRQLDEAARAVQHEAGHTDVRGELDRARETVRRAAVDTEKVIRKDIQYVAEAFGEAEHM